MRRRFRHGRPAEDRNRASPTARLRLMPPPEIFMLFHDRSTFAQALALLGAGTLLAGCDGGASDPCPPAPVGCVETLSEGNIPEYPGAYGVELRNKCDRQIDVMVCFETDEMVVASCQEQRIRPGQQALYRIEDQRFEEAIKVFVRHTDDALACRFPTVRDVRFD
jgi:hypothetical protein